VSPDYYWNSRRQGVAVDQGKIERALDACYDAILAPETWSHDFHQLARFVDAISAVFLSPELQFSQRESSRRDPDAGRRPITWIG